MAGRIKAIFKFKPFSKKQLKVLTWWLPNSPVKDYEGIIADGAIRSGKTLCMSLSFVMWAMETFKNQNFGMCGKTIGSFRRNVLFWLKLMLKSRGYKVEDHRADNLVVVTRGNVVNYFYIFGGKDERSQDLIQGITLAGVFFDEVALMPESFVNQATGRCSVDGSKYWFNCNPDGPYHWFKVNWIDDRDKKKLIYLHFTMDDNLSLSEKIKARYRAMYKGVFFDRYIRGLWVVAEGAIYQLFIDEINGDNKYALKEKPKDLIQINVGVDFGGSASGHAFVATGFTRGYQKIVPLASERHKKKDKDLDIDPDKLGELFCDFCLKIINKYGYITHVYCDNAEQTLIAGLRSTARKNGLGWLRIENALKTTINDRIRFVLRMMAQGRFAYDKDECKSLEEALCGALWNPKNLTEDERLDDGTSDIDSLDAFEYTFERDISRFIRYE
ncbi:MAG: PBSX family phage terminase large subunit [Eubacterium sp.]|nr:PBSX family phage terminase large subunit [Eubacterium sp.]